MKNQPLQWPGLTSACGRFKITLNEGENYYHRPFILRQIGTGRSDECQSITSAKLLAQHWSNVDAIMTANAAHAATIPVAAKVSKAPQGAGKDLMTTPQETKAPRSISTIAREISATWRSPNFAAAPYLQAMRSLDKITDRYISDGAEEIVLRFLGNASSWRGEDAKRIKAELKAMLPKARR